MQSLQGKHIHLNIVRVGFDKLSQANQEKAFEKIDYAIHRIREIYKPVNLGVGRILHYSLSSSDADGLDDIGSRGENYKTL
jgi:hypothetical protein